MKMKAETGLLKAKAIRMAMAVRVQELGLATRRWRLSTVAEATVDTMLVAGLTVVAMINNVQYSSYIV